jgi:Ca2+-transporting ATPase
MSHGPTKSNKVLDTKSWIHLITQAVVTTIVVITVYSSLHTRVPELAITSVFTLLAFAEIFRAFTSRSQIYSIFFIGFFKNMVTNIGVLISLALTLAVVYLPAFNHIFATKPLPVNLLVSLALFALIMPITEELTKFLIRLRSPSPIRARPRPDRGRGSGAAPFDGR